LSENDEISLSERNENSKKAVGTAQKIGDLYHYQFNDMDSAIRWYEWSVKYLLGWRNLKDPTNTLTTNSDQHYISSEVPPSQSSNNKSNNDKNSNNNGLEPPSWSSKDELANAMESLAGVYRKLGNYSTALSTYFLILQLLENSPVFFKKETCRSAMVMNNMAEIYISLGEKYYNEATKWSKKGISISEGYNSIECINCHAVLLYNNAMIEEVFIKNFFFFFGGGGGGGSRCFF